MSAQRYLVLLKGINVGRAKRLAMADLRRLLGDLGYTDVRTYLQSGNAVLEASGTTPEAIATAAEAALLSQLDLRVAVVVRDREELAAAIDADPLVAAGVLGGMPDDPSRHLFGFCSAVPSSAAVTRLQALVATRDVDPAVEGSYALVGKHCYLWCPQGVSKSLFATVDWDRTLGVTVTMRNLATVARVRAMLDVAG